MALLGIVNPPPFDYADLVTRLAVDLVALGALFAVVGLRRRARPDFLAVLACFNLGLFVVLTAITATESATAIGFGLFAMLSIIRLRSEEFSSPELGMFFAALVLALVNGSVRRNVPLALILDAIVLAPVVALSVARIGARVRQREITLDCIHADDVALRADVEQRLGVRVTDLDVLEIDYVREITRLKIRYSDTPRGAPLPVAS